MLEAGKNVSPAVNKAIQDKPAAEQVKFIDARMAKAGDNKHLYYPVLAARARPRWFPCLSTATRRATSRAPLSQA